MYNAIFITIKRQMPYPEDHECESETVRLSCRSWKGLKQSPVRPLKEVDANHL